MLLYAIDQSVKENENNNYNGNNNKYIMNNTAKYNTKIMVT